MLTLDQTKSSTVEAFNFIAANPLAKNTALREHLQSWMLTTFADQPEYWGEATEVCGQEIVSLAQRKAYETADKAAKDADEARIMAEWKARMDAPVAAAPVYETTVTPIAPKTRGDHIEAIKSAYSGTDPDNQTFNLQAACRYALLNDLTPDTVANAVGRHHAECANLMYPKL